MTYQETLDYLFSQLPMFQRIGASAYRANLDNTIALLKACHNPEHKFKSVHVAGTNGKGSTSHLIASVLQSAGYKTGLYTSPHLKDFRERIKINGRCISEKDVVNFVDDYKTVFEDIKPSFFEMTVAMAFDYFAKERVDMAVVEVGMGGRLDSTNLIHPLVSVITNIGLDHTQFLGETIEAIAKEKAGIIKKNTPVVIGQTQKESAPVFIEKAKEMHTDIKFADQEFYLKHIERKDKLYFDIYKANPKHVFDKVSCDLTGVYQEKNIITAFTSLQIIRRTFDITEQNIRDGFSNTVKNTGLLGRWQKLFEHPLTVCDTGHNKDGILEVIKQIELTPHQHLHFVIGMVSDKNIDAVLKLLPQQATYYFCKADMPRALDALLLQEQARKYGLTGQTYTSVKEALKSAQLVAKSEDLILVGGSTFVVAEVV